MPETFEKWFKIDFAAIERRIMSRKEIMPSRDERTEQMGKPKLPKMGGITPATVELPDVDDLLKKLKRASALNGVLYKEQGGHCHIACKCGPCQSGYCSKCEVEAVRDHPDRFMVRSLVRQYRA
jgi:hypothetical protein